jgi:hypothetical protein
MRTIGSTAIALLAILLLSAQASAQQRWSAERVGVIDDEGLETPESVLPGEDGQHAWVSNVQITESGGPWTDDGKGFISLLRAPDKIETLRWRAGAGPAKLNATKGMCRVAGNIWASDNGRVVRFPLDGPKGGKVVEVPNAEQLNDMASNGKAAWVSDMATGMIHRLGPNGEHRAIQGPEAVNGITFHDGQMYAVSWGKHDLYKLDPNGENPPEPFGLAEHFQNLDGIEFLGDGSIIVSDFTGGKVAVVTPNREKVYTLIEMQTPADIGLDRRGKRLYVPSFEGDRIEVYRLRKK